MSFPSTVFEDPPRAWGIGRVVVDGVVTPWPVSKADVDDEADSMAVRLAALGLGEGGLVLIVSLLSQTIHVAPFELAAGRVGARVLVGRRDTVRRVPDRVADPPAPPDGRARRRRTRARRPRGAGPRPRRGLRPGARGRRGRRRREGPARRRRASPPGRWVMLGPTSALQAPGDDTFVYDDDPLAGRRCRRRRAPAHQPRPPPHAIRPDAHRPPRRGRHPRPPPPLTALAHRSGVARRGTTPATDAETDRFGVSTRPYRARSDAKTRWWGGWVSACGEASGRRRWGAARSRRACRRRRSR